MQDLLRDFPSYGWICKLNEQRYFSGSIGTDGRRGMFSVDTFHYRLWKKEVKDEEGNTRKFLCAKCYVQPPQNSGKDSYGHDELELPLSEQSAQDIKTWLISRVEKYDYIEK